MDEFLKACGATGPLQLLVENRGLAAMRWNAPQPFALIGRDPEMDLSLDHPRIDGHHAYLQVIDGEVFCIDLGTQTGTRWENGPARSGWLSLSHGIGIGPYVIQLAPGDREVTGSTQSTAGCVDPLSSRPQADDDLPPVTLEFCREGAKPIRWRMRHVLTLVGTSPHCKVRLAAPGVSPFHCSLLRTTVGMWAVNLLGQTGVTVNGSSIRASRLDAGDELKIGDILVRVLYETRDSNGRLGALAGHEKGRTTFLIHPRMTSNELATSRSQAVWMAREGEAGNLLAERVTSEGELSASLLALVLDQFGQMQQQFLNQFQQTALMMFRALGTMHRDQMEELREKLDSLHRLGENLQALQAQMSATTVSREDQTAHDRQAVGALPHQQLTAAPRTTDEAASHLQGNSVGAAMGRQTSPATTNDTDPLCTNGRSSEDRPNLPPMPSPNVHEWLIGRLAALEDEQRSRWQKILDLLRGR